MSYLPTDAEQQFDTAEETRIVDPAESPFFSILSNLVDQLADGLDHPELWPMLADAAQHDDIAPLRDLIYMVLDGQSGTTLKSLQLLAGLLHALSVDREAGLEFIARMAEQHAHCPQIAGALFFLDRLGSEKSADLSSRFCEAPFIKFETLMDGTVAPCCSIWTQQRLGTLDGQTFEDIWNSEDAQKMRASIHDGSYRYCNKQRCSLIMDDALPAKSDVTDPGLRQVIDHGITHMEASPRWLFLAHDVTCNLACPSCRGGIEVASEAQERRFEIIEQQVFQPLLNADGEVLISVSGQGDPWSSPHYRSILRYMADHDLRAKLEIHTNALLMGEGRWAQYAGLDRYRPLVNVSIDSCSPWVYDYVRRPGKWEKLYPNLQFIAAKRAKGDFSAFHLNATIQLDNYHEMPALVRLAETLGADTMRLYMMQNTGGHLAADYPRKNIGAIEHPLHKAFLETLRDPALGHPVAHLYDVGTWRTRAFEATLPSDALGADFGRERLADALRAASTDPAERVALCVAGRIRFPTDITLLQIEAQALNQMGYRQQAEYRIAEAVALGGEAIAFA